MFDDWDGFCHRCGKRTLAHSMSYFNRDLCCPECLRKEREHPAYAEAKRVEGEQVLAGNYNYGGVGKPRDL